LLLFVLFRADAAESGKGDWADASEETAAT